MKTYQEGKEEAREEAKQWQRDFSETSHSWDEIAEKGAYFEKLGRKYGLLREFKENGII